MSDTESDDDNHDIRVNINNTVNNTLPRQSQTIVWSVGDFPPPGVQVSRGRNIRPSTSSSSTLRVIEPRQNLPLHPIDIAMAMINNAARQNVERIMVEIALTESMEDEDDTMERKESQEITFDVIKYNPKKHDVGEDKCCPICQVDYVKGDELGILQCDHIFHTNCIEEWGKYKAECPMCRKSIKLAVEEETVS